MMNTNKKNELRLLGLGFLTLFLELILIRYLAGNIWNLGYFPNLVLLSAFVGIGLGFLLQSKITEEHSKMIFNLSSFLLLLLISLVFLFHPGVPGFNKNEGNLGGELFFTFTNQDHEDQFSAYVIFPLCFVLISLIFAFISQRTAKYFLCFSSLKAYTLDIIGSCFGILFFMAIGFFQVTAYLWFLVLIPVYVLLETTNHLKPKLIVTSTLLLSSLIAFIQDKKILIDLPTEIAEKITLETVWSPYQKLDLIQSLEKRVTIYANNIVHQAVLKSEELSQYGYKLPYTERLILRQKNSQVPPIQKVLIIGAGNGNDVSAALQEGVSEVDAVEIDPAIANFGKSFHHLKPFDDPRVHLHINDGRAFLTNTQKKYDLIIFALTDSLVKASAMTQLRLENFLFTQNSIERAYELLSPQGNLVLYNYYRKPWLIQKIAKMIHQGTGIEPKILMQENNFAMFSVLKPQAESQPQTHFRKQSLQLPQSVPTDDWPFLYLEKNGIPTIYQLFIVIFMVFIIGIVTLVHKKIAPFSESDQELNNSTNTLSLKVAFLLMGSAFLLLETKSIIQFGLLFGVTWLNSSLVFLGILVTVLLANWCAAFSFINQKKQILLFCCLIVSSLIPLLYPLSHFLQIESIVLRFFLAALFTFLPLFFANLIFSANFKDQVMAEHLFGWNLIGATLGGVLEYTSMLVGYNILAILVCTLYAIVFLLIRRSHSHSHSHNA